MKPSVSFSKSVMRLLDFPDFFKGKYLLAILLILFDRKSKLVDILGKTTNLGSNNNHNN